MPLESTVALILKSASLTAGGLMGVGAIVVMVSPRMP
jgi:hypothetical protein